ncbi:MAG: ABC transporter substrate-binding protein [Alphaproteobacteria bacterium]|nr:ABC transporter substrate-binding protein [Alphaproteobacteria bacterium]
MLRRTMLAGLAVALGLATGAAAQTAPLPIKIGAANATDHAAAFIGVERGIFAKHGLDAKLVMYQTGVEMINGLLNGAQEVNIMGSIPFLAGVSNGQPLVLIGHLHGDALSMSYSMNNSIVATPASGIKEGDVKALKGKKIGLPRGTGAEGYLLGILAQNGMRDSDVTLVNIAPSNQTTALRQGDVDALAAWEPWGTISSMRVPGAYRVVTGGCDSCYDPGSILTTRAAIAGKAEQLRRFMVAFAEAHQWLRQNYDAAAEINMRWIQGVDIDVMKTAIRRSGYDLRVTRNTIEGYNTITIPALVKDKRMAKTVDAATIVDAQFYKHVEATAPQFFSDLKPVPADRRL